MMIDRRCFRCSSVLALAGTALATEQLHFSRAVDRGWPDYDDPLPPGHGESPSVFPREWIGRESSEMYFRDLAPECLGGGCHTVVTVAPGGASFDVDFLSPEDESLRVVGHRSFEVEG